MREGIVNEDSGHDTDGLTPQLDAEAGGQITGDSIDEEPSEVSAIRPADPFRATRQLERQLGSLSSQRPPRS